jgi:hypothetical protein
MDFLVLAYSRWLELPGKAYALLSKIMNGIVGFRTLMIWQMRFAGLVLPEAMRQGLWLRMAVCSSGKRRENIVEKLRNIMYIFVVEYGPSVLLSNLFKPFVLVLRDPYLWKVDKDKSIDF